MTLPADQLCLPVEGFGVTGELAVGGDKGQVFGGAEREVQGLRRFEWEIEAGDVVAGQPVTPCAQVPSDVETVSPVSFRCTFSKSVRDGVFFRAPGKMAVSGMPWAA